MLPVLHPQASFAKPVILESRQKEFGNLMPGKPLIIQKVYDPATGRISIRSADGQIKSAGQLVQMEEADRENFRARYGRMSPSLVSELKSADPKEPKRVAVTLKPPMGITYLDKFSHTEEELKRNSLDAAMVKPPRNLGAVLSGYALHEKVEVSDFSAIVRATPGELAALAMDPYVASLEIHDSTQTTTMPILPKVAASLFSQTGGESYIVLSRSAYCHSQTAIPTNLAVGAKGATFEAGLKGSFLGCSVLNPTAWDAQTNPYYPPLGLVDTTTGKTSQYHSLSTFYLMALAAPGANYFHRRSIDYTEPESESFIINNGINSISMSTTGPRLAASFIAMDDFAYRSPYPTFVTPTGNEGYMYPARWAGSYNQINVGMVDDSNFTSFKIPINWCSNGSTQTRNPDPKYGNGCIDGGAFPNCAGDREMPYLVAPGWSPRGGLSRIPGSNNCQFYGTMMSDVCANYLITWGTSSSAPTANGMVLNLLGQVPSLKFYPELTRAVLLATARNVTGGYWIPNVDGLDGSGVIHGQDAISFAKKMVSVQPGGAAVADGYWYQSLMSSDFASTWLQFNAKIPSSLPAGKHLRVVLTWTSSPDWQAFTNDLSDMDIRHPASGTQSMSWDGNIEILDIPAAGTPAGSTQIIEVHPYLWRRGSGARAPNIWAAMAWTFVADHAR